MSGATATGHCYHNSADAGRVLAARCARSARPTPAAAQTMFLKGLIVLFCLQLADFTDPPCVIDLECEECIPDNMAMVTSHGVTNGSVLVAAGAEVVLACAGGKFLLYPLRETLAAVCEGGRYRVREDHALRHLLELGCQESVFEDVLHQVDQCGGPLQGRAYQMQEVTHRGVRHLATVCFDADRGVPAHMRVGNAPHAGGLTLAPHAERAGPLSLLGNFNHMFDARARAEARALYGDETRLTRRLHELLKHEGFSFAEQTLAAARLLAPQYFDEQSSRVADFPSNRVAAWRSVVQGNLKHLQSDVAALMRRTRGTLALDVYAGTHGVLALGAGAGAARTEVWLKAGRRYPVPRYLWTAVVARDEGRGLALVLLNDPLVAVSDIREAVFCESRCGSVSWLRALLRHRDYERPAAGLVFCCSLQDFAEKVTEMPKIFNDTVKLLL